MASINELKFRMENWRVLWVVSLAGEISFLLFRLTPSVGWIVAETSRWLSLPVHLLFIWSSYHYYVLYKQILKKIRCKGSRKKK